MKRQISFCRYKTRRNLLSIGVIGISLIIFNCTDLTEKYNANITSQQAANTSGINDRLYAGLISNLRNAFQDPTNGFIPLSELTTDELIAPTRVADWDDNGQWRALHLHQWTADNSQVVACFNALSGIVFSATDLLQPEFKATKDQKTNARFYRAWAMYCLLDLFDQVPYRDPGESTLLQARVMTGLVALDSIIKEVNSLMVDLSDGPATQPTKNAAKVFLMKCYLNKAVYATRKTSIQFSFDPADMNKVISYADEVINSGQYTFSANYFDNFAPENGNLGKENIFTLENVGGTFGSVFCWYSLIPLHYLSTPSGFNGWATLSAFYDKFEANDLRRGQAYNYPGAPPNIGNRINLGLLIGPQYDLFADTLLYDGVPAKTLVQFTRDVHNIETGPGYRISGIRPIKYAPDFSNYFYLLDNDWAYFRLPDVLLMKAEAILRSGTATSANYGSTALELVNSIRTHASRGASALSNIDLPTLIDERGRELWLECWRRQDMIRFGTFLQPFQEKEYPSDAKYLLFPIPSQQVAVNKNLTQNPGY